jgi:hypothetical protein
VRNRAQAATLAQRPDSAADGADGDDD